MKTIITTTLLLFVVIATQAQDLKAFKDNNKYGYKDSKGKVIIQPKYDLGLGFSEGLAIVQLNKKRGFIDKTGKEVITLQYDNAEDFSEGMAAVQNSEKKWGFIDKNGNIVVPYQYFQVGKFSEGLVAVYVGGKKLSYSVTGGKWGFIDKTGTLKIPAVYEDVHYKGFSEGLCAVTNESSLGKSMSGQKFGYINTKGELVIPYQFNEANEFSEGIALVGIDIDKQAGKGKYSFIKKDGKILFSWIDCATIIGNGKDFKEKGKILVETKILPTENDKYYINIKGEKVK